MGKWCLDFNYTAAIASNWPFLTLAGSGGYSDTTSGKGGFEAG